MSYVGSSLNRLTASRQMAVVGIACLVWIGCVLVLDHFVVFRKLSSLGNCLLLEFKLTVPAGQLSVPPVSLIVLLGVPLVVLWFARVPWSNFRDGAAWQSAFFKWCQPVFWLAIAVVLTVVGQSIFLLSKEHLPKGLADLSEKFALDVTVKSWDRNLATLNGTLSALLGLVIGTYLFLLKGVRRALD